jgi:chromosome segregation ATPase
MSTFSTDPALLESELERAQANVAELKKQLAGKTVELQQMLGVLGTYQQNAGAPPPETDQVRALQASLADMNAKYQEAVADQSRAQQRVELLMAHLRGQNVDLSQLGGGSDEFRQKYEQAAAQLSATQQEMAGHVSMRTALEGRINELQNYITTIQQAYNDQQQLLQTKHNEAYQLSAYVESMKAKFEAVAGGAAQVDAANARVNELTADVTRLRGEVEELMAENERLKSQPPPAAAPSGASAEELASVQAQLASVQAQFAAVQAQLASAQAQLGESESRVAEADRRAKEASEQAAMAEQLALTVDDLQRKLAAASKQGESSEQLQRELEQLTSRLSEATELADRMASDNAALQSQQAEALAAMEADMQTALQAAKLAAERLAAAEAELTGLREQVARTAGGPTQAEVESLQAQIKEWKTKLAASEKERWELGPKVEELQKQAELSRQRTNVLLQKNRESFTAKLEEHDQYIYTLLRELRARLDQAEEELRRKAEETAPPPS